MTKKITILALSLGLLSLSIPVSATVTALNVVPDSTKASYYSTVLKAADRLIVLQNANGSWDFDVTGASGPTANTYYNVTGVSAQALLDAYSQSNDVKYLDAAKKAGDYLVNGISDVATNRQNAFNIVFLFNLGQITGDTSYTNTGGTILSTVLTADNYWSNNNGNNCTSSGCTPTQLLEAYKNYRGVPDGTDQWGIVPWDLMAFVQAVKMSGDDATAQAIEQEIIGYVNDPSYTSSVGSYALGLAGAIQAANIVGDSANASSLASVLVSSKGPNGEYGTASEGQIQTTAYALLALKAIGDSNATEAASYINSSFGYSSINGWQDTDGSEYAETDSEATHALFNYFHQANTFYTIQDAVNAASSGSTITLSSGTYDQATSTIVVDKSLTFSGPNSSISPNGGSRTSEAIIEGEATYPNGTFNITSSSADVIFSGLKFQTLGAEMRSDTPGAMITLQKNIFTGSRNDTMYFDDPNLTVDDNLFDSVNLLGVSGETIQMGVPSLSRIGSISITNNTWHNITGNGALNSSGQSGTVSNNTFDGVEYYGILVASDANLTISDNVFNNITNPTVNPTGNELTWGAGVRFYEATTTTVASITGNTFSNSYLGISVRATNSDITGANIEVKNNSFTGNTTAILNAATGTLNASKNWFSSVNGPTVASNINTSTGNTIGESVTYRPWCLTSACSPVDVTVPTVSSVSVSPNPAKAGSITVTVVFSESMNTGISPTVQIVGITGSPISVSETSYVGTTWVGVAAISDNNEELTATTSISGAEDPSGNQLVADNTHNFSVDTIDPIITSLTSVANGGTVLKIGDTITFTSTIAKPEPGATVSGSYNGVTLSWSTLDSGATYTATYTVTSGNTDQVSPVQISGVTITDTAGNVSTSTAGADVTKPIDANKPTLTSVSVSTNNSSGKAMPGDIITLSFNSSEPINAPVVTIAGHSGTSVTISGSGTSWTASTTMTSGDTEGSIPFTINFSDIAGNSGVQVSTLTSGSLVVFDRTSLAPVSFSAGSPTASSLTLSWSNSESNGSYYTIKESTNPITDITSFNSAVTLGGVPIPASGAQGYAVKNLNASTTYYFAIRLTDAVGNISSIATTSEVTLASNASSSDIVAPSTISDLSTQAGTTTTSQIKLTWTAPGDDSSSGIASKYIIKRSSSPITDSPSFDSATTIFNAISPKSSGGTETFTVTGLTYGTTYYFAVEAVDEANNTSAVSNSASLTTSSAIPTVSSIVTSSGVSTSTNNVSTSTTVTGTNFIVGSNTVRFTSGSNVINLTGTSTNSTSINLTIPVGIPEGLYGVKVINDNGNSDILASAYTVIVPDAPLPNVSDVSPTTIGTNDTNVDITIAGSHFTGATAVSINGVSLSAVTVVSDTQITATLSGIAVEGAYDVKVTSPNGTNQISSVKLNVKAPVQINSTTTQEQTTTQPIDMGNTNTIPVQITLQSDDTVVNTDTVGTVEVVIPPATTVTKADGTAYTGNINPPQIVKPTEEISSKAGDNAIVITMGNPGEKINFSNDFVTTVTLESSNSTAPLVWYFNPVSGLEIAGKDGTKDGVTYTKGGKVLNTVVNGSTYTYTIGLLLDHMSSYVAGVQPTITNVSPVSGPIGTTVVITGTNFSPGATVKFGSTQASSITVNSVTQITAVVPIASVSSYVVIVTNADNLSATSSVNFSLVQGSGGGTVGTVSSGGGASFTPTPQPIVSTPQPVVGQVLSESASTAKGEVLGASTFNFLKDLKVGSRGDDVTELQKILISEGLLSSNATGFFGDLTRNALVKWQAKNNLPATGFFGAMTRAKVSARKEMVSDSEVLGASTFNFLKDLKVGSRGDDVTELQKILISEGLLSSNATGFFGDLTRNALVKWQAKNNLPATGFFGAMTRDFIKKTGVR